MDIFRFHNPGVTLKMSSGEIIDGFTSKMWVERYRDNGEFKLTAPAESNMRSRLPIGSFISHVNSREIMIVEDHVISNDKGTESEIQITGRSFETYLENRSVGSNVTGPVLLTTYTLVSNQTWVQAQILIEQHILAQNTTRIVDSMQYTKVNNSVSGYSGVSIARDLKPDSVYKHLMDLLPIDNLGIRTFRPGPWNPLGPTDQNTCIQIHRGTDKSATMMFNYDTGEVVSAEYLWSNRKKKNAALVVGKWVVQTVLPSDQYYARRWMVIQASDIDDSYTSAPLYSDIAGIGTEMTQRANEALASQKDVTLTKADISVSPSLYKYRTDFDVGDVVTVTGDYNTTQKMRISEYVEIEDSSGEVGYPTFSVD
jgi:Siphovirus ReqiPepy6 Gp37-like protein